MSKDIHLLSMDYSTMELLITVHTIIVDFSLADYKKSIPDPKRPRIGWLSFINHRRFLGLHRRISVPPAVASFLIILKTSSVIIEFYVQIKKDFPATAPECLSLGISRFHSGILCCHRRLYEKLSG